MEHFTDILFKRLEESEEYANFQRDFDALQKTIQNKSGLKDIYALVKTEAFPASMKKRTRLIIEEYLRDLLKDIGQDALELSCSHVSVSVSLPYEEVPSVEYKPFHWATPTTCLLTIDFASQKIKVYDASKEYKEAKRILEKNILKETEKLADMKDRLAVMKENQNFHSERILRTALSPQRVVVSKDFYPLCSLSFQKKRPAKNHAGTDSNRERENKEPGREDKKAGEARLLANIQKIQKFAKGSFGKSAGPWFPGRRNRRIFSFFRCKQRTKRGVK